MENGEWKMENEFVKVKLGDVVEFFNNLRIPLSSNERKNRKGHYRYYGAQGVIDYVNDYIFDGEYILIAEDGENLKSRNQDIALFVMGKFWVNNHAHIIKTKNICDMQYFYYLINNIDISNFVTGSSQPKLSMQSLKKIEFKIHKSIDTQKKIAKVLSVIDEKIELNKKINQKLEEITKLLYEYYFVQFDFPDKNGKPYKSSGGEMVYNEKLKREIPKGWEVIKLENLVKIDSGYPFKSSSYKETGKYKIITIQNVQDMFLNLSKCVYIDNVPESIKNTSILKKGDILISLTGDVGRVCYVYEDNLLLNQRVGHIFSDKLSNNVIYYIFNLNFIKEELKQIASGSNQKNLSPIEMLKIEIPYNKEIFELYNQQTKGIFEMLIQNQLQIQKLESLRDFLLPMLLNGQVIVNEK